MKLQCISDEFTFSFKVYDLEGRFIEHVLKTWNATDKNLGILLNGTKGSGKTQTGKLLANATGLPIILIDSNSDGVLEFIKGFDFPCVLFFDEYEKVFEEDGDILTLMDGMYSDLNRKMFILTTNEKHINMNLLSRPSRIRYFREFTNIPLDMMVAYIKDNLKDSSRIEEIIRFIDKLEISTIDIVKAIVEEINLHDCSTEDILEFMNLKKKEIRIDCIYSEKGTRCEKIDSFKALCKSLYKPGKNLRGEMLEYLTPRDLGLYISTFTFSNSPANFKVGDAFSDGSWVINQIIPDDSGEVLFLEVIRYGEDTYYFCVENTSENVNSIYGSSIMDYVF